MDTPHSNGRLLSGTARYSSPAARGITLVEVLVALAIVAILAALVVPNVGNRLSKSHAEALITEMQNLEQGVRTFQRDVGRYPMHLKYLSVLEDSVSIRDACGAVIPAPLQLRYRGPYINRHIALIQPYLAPVNTKWILATGDSVESVLTRGTMPTVGGGTQQVLHILLHGPDAGLTAFLDSTVDRTLDDNEGTVQYTIPLNANDNVVHWVFPIRNGAC